MALNFFINLIFFIGLSLIVIGIAKKQAEDQVQPQVEYRYIPRTFREEQQALIRPSEIFSDMFNRPTPWVAGTRLGDEGSSRRTYQFISQE